MQCNLCQELLEVSWSILRVLRAYWFVWIVLIIARSKARQGGRAAYLGQKNQVAFRSDSLSSLPPPFSHWASLIIKKYFVCILHLFLLSPIERLNFKKIIIIYKCHRLALCWALLKQQKRFFKLFFVILCFLCIRICT